jgi:hypothetical protein
MLHQALLLLLVCLGSILLAVLAAVALQEWLQEFRREV